MCEINEELHNLSYEVWQIYELMRVLVLVIDTNCEYQEYNENLLNTIIIAEDIEKRLQPIVNQQDTLSMSK